MIIKTICGEIEIEQNKLYYDISQPIGAVRSFIVISNPVLIGDSISWYAKSDDCYNEIVNCMVTLNQPEKILIFNDYESASRFLVSENIKIQLSSIEYQLMSIVGTLCDNINEEKIDYLKTVFESLELDLLTLKLKTEIYDISKTNLITDIYSRLNRIVEEILDLKTLTHLDSSILILSWVNQLKHFKEIIATIRKEFDR